MNADATRLVGTWNLVSAVMEDTQTCEQVSVWGEHPHGCLILTASGRWLVLQTAEGRSVPKSDADRAAAFRSMLAYTGKYRVEGDKIVIAVDIAWDESWTGGTQVRLYKIAGDRLHIEAAPQPYANFGGRVMRGTVIWQRETSYSRAKGRSRAIRAGRKFLAGYRES
jgi:Lipocalin-like domain